MKEGRSSELKDNLIEHFDFVAVSAEVWKHMYSWYSSDWTVVRFVKRDRTNKKSYYLDLYPERNIYQFDKESEICESDSDTSILYSLN